MRRRCLRALQEATGQNYPPVPVGIVLAAPCCGLHAPEVPAPNHLRWLHTPPHRGFLVIRQALFKPAKILLIMFSAAAHESQNKFHRIANHVTKTTNRKQEKEINMNQFERHRTTPPPPPPPARALQQKTSSLQGFHCPSYRRKFFPAYVIHIHTEYLPSRPTPAERVAVRYDTAEILRRLTKKTICSPRRHLLFRHEVFQNVRPFARPPAW